MATLQLFSSFFGKQRPATTRNEAGGKAYAFSPKHALAQYAATGCFNSTFYASGEEQLEKVLELAQQVDPKFVAQTAVFCRQQGRMKDMPALLCAVLTVLDPELLARVFDLVIDDAKMLRNFVQIVRSGVVARKSLGTAPRRLVRKWLAARDEASLFRANVGQNPSLADVIKLAHPKPESEARRAFYGYLLDKCSAEDAGLLPEVVREFEAYKRTRTGPVPDVPFQMLTALDLGSAEWAQVARQASFQTTRMNLNTFARHGVFEVPGLTKIVAARLRNPTAVARSRVQPYQLLMAHGSCDAAVPAEVVSALEDALELALGNVPKLSGKAFVLVDVSGSMSSPVTGHRVGATTKVRCVDVAALFAAALLRQNPDAEVLPFSTHVERLRVSSRDSVMTNARLLAAVGGGGTNTSAALAALNERRAQGDLIIYVSDNESWMDPVRGRGTATLNQWEQFRARNRSAKLVCIDLQPYTSSQVPEREDILNVGGFSDQVFALVREFDRGTLNPQHWVGAIEAISL
jgi:60 kDa SS-A/Ro ribonucleoprotein